MEAKKSLSVASRIAGVVQPRCTCCAASHTLVAHDSLGESRRFCPASGTVYLDRGDGKFLPDLDRPEPVRPQPVAAGGEPDLVSDRPVRTDEKTRIELERATFAGPAGG